MHVVHVFLALVGLIAPLQVEPTTADDLQEFEKRLQTIARKVGPAVVTFRWSGDDKNSSSGVVFDESGLVLTHGHHGHEPSERLSVVFTDGRIVPAKLVSVFDGIGADWSLVKIEKAGKWPAAPIYRGKRPEVNQWCIHMGYPSAHIHDKSRTPLLRLGRIVGLGQYGVYASCTVHQGDSGGPLFDLEGRVIGVGKSSIGFWTDVLALAPDLLLGTFDLNEERRRLGLVGKNRRPVDKNHGIPARPFEALLEPARRATVRVLVDDQPAALGVVVDSNGIILTKRSEILTRDGEPAGRLSCRLPDGDRLAAKVIGDLHDHDVALVQVDRRGLPNAPWSDAKQVEQGWLTATVGLQQEPLAVGVVSTDQVFKMPLTEGYAFLDLRPEEGGMRVTTDDKKLGRICPSDIRSADLITHVEGTPTPDESAYGKAIGGKQYVAGDLIRMTILRDGRTCQVVFPMVPSYGGRRFLNAFDFSWRRTGFPAVIGHDGVLDRQQCGGPLVDARGQVIGINIARYHNYLTFTIPHTIVRRLVEEMLAAREWK